VVYFQLAKKDGSSVAASALSVPLSPLLLAEFLLFLLQTLLLESLLFLLLDLLGFLPAFVGFGALLFWLFGPAAHDSALFALAFGAVAVYQQLELFVHFFGLLLLFFS
jgi:hypothetical protein